MKVEGNITSTREVRTEDCGETFIHHEVTIALYPPHGTTMIPTDHAKLSELETRKENNPDIWNESDEGALKYLLQLKKNTETRENHDKFLENLGFKKITLEFPDE